MTKEEILKAYAVMEKRNLEEMQGARLLHVEKLYHELCGALELMLAAGVIDGDEYDDMQDAIFCEREYQSGMAED